MLSAEEPKASLIFNQFHPPLPRISKRDLVAVKMWVPEFLTQSDKSGQPSSTTLSAHIICMKWTKHITIEHTQTLFVWRICISLSLIRLDMCSAAGFVMFSVDHPNAPEPQKVSGWSLDSLCVLMNHIGLKTNAHRSFWHHPISLSRTRSPHTHKHLSTSPTIFVFTL